MEKKLSVALNQYLANVGVEYIKLHNLHWNVVGPDFKQVHEYLETLYDGYAAVLDTVAEVLKMHGASPLASIKDYQEVATIAELDSAERRSGEVLEIVQEDLSALKMQAEAIRASADQDGLYDVVSIMEEQLANYNKTLWFIQAMQK